jgi:hypothetical protein
MRGSQGGNKGLYENSNEIKYLAVRVVIVTKFLVEVNSHASIKQAASIVFAMFYIEKK